MSNPNERSVSPQTITSSPGASSGFGIGSIFSFVKDFIPKTGNKHIQPPKSPVFDEANNSDLEIIQNEKLLNDFSSAKKKRLSIQGHPKNGFIPRSSTMNNNKGLYKTLYDNLKTSKEEESNDLERRMSTVYGNIMKDSVQEPRILSRDTSPLGEITPVPESSNGMFSASDSPRLVPASSLVKVDSEGTPLIIEHEFAPLYTDDDGNLVRPPFINIDPRERYQLLQLKKSIEASEALQSRLKYMVNPHETTSTFNKSNKVETSTQTHDIDYLENKLSFGKRRIDPSTDNRQSKKPKKNTGIFGGDFYYDDKKDTSKSINQLGGYLGSISKPKFQSDKKISSEAVSTEDDDKPFNKFGGNFPKSTTQRSGLDDSLFNNKKVEISLSKDYKQETEKSSNVIKLKEDTLFSDQKKKETKPSSGFNFAANKPESAATTSENVTNESNKAPTKIDSLKLSNTAAESIKPPSSTGFSFGKTDEQNAGEPRALFGAKATKISSKKVENEQLSSGFSFGQNNNTPAPSLAEKSSSGHLFSQTPRSDEPKSSMFGKDTTTPAFSFGSSDGNDKKPLTGQMGADTAQTGDKAVHKESSSKFSFGSTQAIPKPSEENKSQVSGFQFGDKKANETSKKFQFGDEKSDDTSKSTFSFGGLSQAKPLDDSKTASNLFGNTSTSTSTPQFSFGEKKTESSEAPALAPSSIKDSSKSDTSKPLFGAADLSQSKPLFGSSSTEANSTSKFAFGETPSSNLFGSKASDDNTTKPSTSGSLTTGSESSVPIPKSTFSFDSPATQKDDDESDRPKKKVRSLSGESNVPPLKKSEPFSFTNPSSSSATPATPVLFGKADSSKPSAGESKPAFSFGAKPAEQPKQSSSPAPFAFGSNSGTPKPSDVFGAKEPSSFGTPAPGQTPGSANGGSSFSFTSKNTNPKFKFAAGISTMKPIGVSNGPGSTSSAFGQATGGFGQSPGFNQNGAFGPSPAFGQAQASPGFGQSQPQGVFGQNQPPTAFGQNQPQGGFGQTQPQGGFGQSNGFGQPPAQTGFGQPAGFSKESTPTFSFGNKAAANPASVFGQPQQPQGQPQGFNFGSREPTPDPASIFSGGAGGLSMPQPSQGFGAAPQGGVPGNTPTPPLRRIAHPRRRR